MWKLVAFAAAAILVSITTQVGATVTWSFYETGVSGENCRFGSCVLPPQPYVLAQLTLLSDTSTGSATFFGGRVPLDPPVTTGDGANFSLVIGDSSAYTLSPGNMVGHPDPLNGSSNIVEYNISWTEAAGMLNAVHIDYDAFANGELAQIGVMLGLGGGPIAADLTLGGCTDTRCDVTGFWQSDLAVREPMSASLLVSGLLGLVFARRYRLR